MSRIIPKAPPTRHREIVGSFGSGGFVATRDRRTAFPKPQAKPRATRDAAVKATATLTKMTAGAAAITTRMNDTGDSLARIADGLRVIADRRRANAPSDGIHRFGTSGAVQAANAARSSASETGRGRCGGAPRASRLSRRESAAGGHRTPAAGA